MKDNQLYIVEWSKYRNHQKLLLHPLDMNSCSSSCFYTDIMQDKSLYTDNRMEKQMEEQFPTRVILLGEPNSGKTNLIEFIKRNCKLTKEIHLEGIKISYVNYINTWKKIRLNLSFWNFDCKDFYYSPRQFYLHDKCQYIITVNLLKLENKNPKIRYFSELYLETWMSEVKKRGSPPLIIICSHADDPKVDTPKCIDKIEKFADSMSLTNLKIIAQVNFEEIMNYIELNSHSIRISKLFLSKNVNNCTTTCQYLLLVDEIEKQKESTPFLHWNEFKSKIFPSNYTEEEMIFFTEALKNSGVIETYLFQSTASNIIILNPFYISEIYLYIISIKTSNRNQFGYYSKSQIESVFKKFKIQESMWFEIETIFSMLNILIHLPSDEYLVSGMIYLNLHSNNFEFQDTIKLIVSQLIENKFSIGFRRRKYVSNSFHPIDFVHRLVIKFLHFPGIQIHESSKENDFYLYTSIENSFFHILIIHDNTKKQVSSINTLEIILFYPKELETSNSLFLCFFCYFIFQAPFEILSSFPRIEENATTPYLCVEIDYIFKSEFDCLKTLNDGFSKYYYIPSCIPFFHCEFNKCLYKEKKSDRIWLGSMISNSSKNYIIDVIFKEIDCFYSKNDFISFIKELIILKMAENQFFVKLIGLCTPTLSLFESRVKAKENKFIFYHKSDEDEENSEFEDFKVNIDVSDTPCDEDMFFKRQIIMILEEGTWGNLRECYTNNKDLSLKVKLKFAYDVARGLRSLNSTFSKYGQVIHGQITAKNVYIFSINENSVYDENSVHAKLGNFEKVVFGASSFSQPIRDYQYTAPEALRGSLTVPYSSNIDVYSFGILFWEILSEMIPFKELTDNYSYVEAIEMVLKGHRPAIHLVDKNYSSTVIQDCAKLTQACLSANPSERPNFEAIVDILHNMLIECDKF